MDEIIKKTFKRIGLSEKEIKVYIKSLQLGPQAASNIARNTDLPRATVYSIFDSMIEKGLASKRERAGVTIFSVVQPQKIIDSIEQEKQQLINKKEKEKKQVSKIIPLLKNIELDSSNRPKISYFEGSKGVRQAYETTLNNKEKLIRAYANPEEMHKGLPNFFPTYYRRRSEKGIEILCFCPDNSTSIERQSFDAQESRTIKLIPEGLYSFTPEMNIFDDKILYASWTERLAIIIESKEIAEFHKRMFDLLWSKTT